MPDNFFLGFDFDRESDAPISFLDTRLNDLSPFSAHEVEIGGEIFKTAEHAYHALRIKPGPEQEQIKNATSPLEAWTICQKYKNTDLLIDDFDKLALMEKIFRAKLTQHESVREVLLLTKDRELIKQHDQDKFWGQQADGSGENQMGKLWMKLREELK